MTLPKCDLRQHPYTCATTALSIDSIKTTAKSDYYWFVYIFFHFEQHISSEMRRECKCHGMSGSCTVKTCWMRLPSFREVGNHLKGCFDGASKVLVSNSNFRGPRNNKNNNRLRPYDPNHKPPTEKDLVYFETSPDFCERDPKLGIKGTKGRQCNDTSLGVEGCDLMCCGRGFKTEVREVLERCKCTFQWCCKVKCKVCKTKKTVHTCLWTQGQNDLILSKLKWTRCARV